MITLNSRLFEDHKRLTLSSRIKQEESKIHSRMARINVLEDNAELAFHYTVLRCAFDVIEFIKHYTCAEGDVPQRNYICVSNVKTPASYDVFKKVVHESMQNLLNRQPTSGDRYNGIYFTTLYFLNQIKFED